MKTITYNPETHVLVPRDLIADAKQIFCSDVEPNTNGDCLDVIEWFSAMIAAAPQPEQVESEPVYQVCMADSVSLSGAWIDVDKQTYHDAGLYKEYKLRALYTTPQPDRTAELEAALKVAKAALNRAADKFHDYAEIHAAKEASPENDLKVERNLMLSSDMDKALAKINEVLHD